MRLTFLAILGCLLVGCPADPSTVNGSLSSSSSSSSSGGSSQTGSSRVTASSSVASGSARSGEVTLDTCTTSVAADAPAFYRTYFRCVTVTRDGANTVIRTTGQPPHRSNYYGASSPNYEPFDTSRGGQYHANPNLLRAQNLTFTIPDAPVSRGLSITTDMVDRQAGSNANEYALGPAGVALDSVLLFNATAAPGDNIDNELFTFDVFNGHPEMMGAYHYHSPSPGPLEVLARLGLTTSTRPGFAAVEVYGMMCDGTVVLGCTELNGERVGGPTLDGQNGHSHNLSDGAGALHFTDRYHVHVCPAEYPTHKYTPEIRAYSTCTITR